MSTIDQYSRLGEEAAAAELVRLGENATADQVTMKEPEYQWSQQDCAAAAAQGWNLFEAHGETVELQLQRDDEANVFADDDAVAKHVQARADSGERVAIRAIQALVAAGSSDVTRFGLKVPEGDLTQNAESEENAVFLLPVLTEKGTLNAADAAAYLKLKAGSRIEIVPAVTAGAPFVVLAVSDTDPSHPYFEVENDLVNGGCWDVMSVADLGGVAKLQTFFETAGNTLQSSQLTTGVRWSDWRENPFKAIKAAAEARGTPQDYDRALDVLRASAEWENFDLDNFLDDVLQEIAGETNIVCQYAGDASSGRRFRAAYDEDPAPAVAPVDESPSPGM